jgi:hypothetical protein
MKSIYLLYQNKRYAVTVYRIFNNITIFLDLSILRGKFLNIMAGAVIIKMERNIYKLKLVMLW